MIIKNINIKNFRSYYGDNFVEFSNGLTLIIGGNGDGKTTFFEAFEWLMNTSVDDKRPVNVSEKRKSELAPGEFDELSVSISFEHNGDKELVKRFRFEKNDDGSISVKDYEFVGYINEDGERRQVSGSQLLEKCFESEVRMYCMFKGESELNIFGKNDTAIKKLVDTFSDIKQFDDLEKISMYCEDKSQNVVQKEMQSDKKTQKKAKELTNNINYTDDQINRTLEDIQSLEKNISTYSTVINQIETIQETSDKWQELKKRIQALEERLASLKSNIRIDYNTELLDNYWILKSYGPILEEYRKKVSNFSIEKRKLEKQDDVRRGAEKAKKEVIEDLQHLANGVAPLPWNLPDRDTMQEMIDAEVCKVCGRTAPKGSEAYNFMVRKLEDYLNHIQQQRITVEETKEEEPPLFPNSIIEEMNTRKIKFCDGESESWIAGISKNILDTIQFIAKRKEDIIKVQAELQDAMTDRENLLIQSPGLTAEALDKSFKDYKGNYEARERANIRLAELQNKLKNLKDDKAGYLKELNDLEPTNSLTKLYMKIHNVFNKILDAVQKAKENNIDSFINLLQEKANLYLQKLNENDFYGIIKLKRRQNGSADILLVSSNGTEITNPNGALKTTMYMSVLFAISRITTLKRDQDYPLIFDAPTSSFEDFKEEVFYNVIDKIEKQCIIATKDLLINNGNGTKRLNMDKINKLSCSVYQIQKAEGYDDQDLSTIQTTLTKIR